MIDEFIFRDPDVNANVISELQNKNKFINKNNSDNNDNIDFDKNNDINNNISAINNDTNKKSNFICIFPSSKQ